MKFILKMKKRVLKMKRTPKEIKQQTEEWLDERWFIANMKDARPQDMSYYMGALKALNLQDMNGNVMQMENTHYLSRLE